MGMLINFFCPINILIEQSARFKVCELLFI